MPNPLAKLSYPVKCTYTGCGEVIDSAIALDEHITAEHLTEAVWNFAMDNTQEVTKDQLKKTDDQLKKFWDDYYRDVTDRIFSRGKYSPEERDAQ